MARRGLIGRMREGNLDWAAAGFFPLCMTELTYWHYRQVMGYLYTHPYAPRPLHTAIQPLIHRYRRQLAR